MENTFHIYEEYLNQYSYNKFRKGGEIIINFTCSEQIFMFNGINHENEMLKITTIKEKHLNNYNENQIKYIINLQDKTKKPNRSFFGEDTQKNMIGFLYFFMSCINRYIKYQITYKYPSCFIYYLFFDNIKKEDIENIILPQFDRERIIIYFHIKVDKNYYYFTYLKTKIFNMYFFNKEAEIIVNNKPLKDIYTLIKKKFGDGTECFGHHKYYIPKLNFFLKEKILINDKVFCTTKIEEKKFHYCLNTLMIYDLKPKNIYFSDSFKIDILNTSLDEYIKKIDELNKKIITY